MLKRPPASRGGPAAYFDHVRALVIDTDWPPLPPPVTSHAATSTSSTAARLAWLHARCRYRLGGRRRPWYGVPFHGSGPPAVAATFRRPRFLVPNQPCRWAPAPDFGRASRTLRLACTRSGKTQRAVQPSCEARVRGCGFAVQASQQFILQGFVRSRLARTLTSTAHKHVHSVHCSTLGAAPCPRTIPRRDHARARCLGGAGGHGGCQRRDDYPPCELMCSKCVASSEEISDS